MKFTLTETTQLNEFNLKDVAKKIFHSKNKQSQEKQSRTKEEQKSKQQSFQDYIDNIKLPNPTIFYKCRQAIIQDYRSGALSDSQAKQLVINLSQKAAETLIQAAHDDEHDTWDVLTLKALAKDFLSNHLLAEAHYNQILDLINRVNPSSNKQTTASKSGQSNPKQLQISQQNVNDAAQNTTQAKSKILSKSMNTTKVPLANKNKIVISGKKLDEDTIRLLLKHYQSVVLYDFNNQIRTTYIEQQTDTD